MIKNLIILLFLISGSYVSAQQVDCKVMKPEISGTYQGGCKKGLAHGKGIAQGIDRYEGEFVKGLPEGKGIYTWASGTYYNGGWKNGLREGEGNMVYKDSTVNGFWQEDKYQGKKLMIPYSIIRSMSVTRYSFNKSLGALDGVKIRIMRGGNDNTDIEDFSLAYDRGQEYRAGNYYGIQSGSFPLNVKVKYRSWNQLRTAQYNVEFEFVINQPGNWEVIIFN